MDSQHSDMHGRETDNPRQRMRDDLITAMRAHHHRRRIRRRSLATVILVICAGTLAYVTLDRNNVTPTPPVVRNNNDGSPLDALREPLPVISESRYSVITIVRTDPNILERYVSRSSSKVEQLSDETLLAMLASLERPTGLIRYDGRVRLTADVTDSLERDDSP